VIAVEASWLRHFEIQSVNGKKYDYRFMYKKRLACVFLKSLKRSVARDRLVIKYFEIQS
jgi:hypothetical protein